MYLLNLLRIYSVFLIGVMGSGKIVMDLFHSYIGMFLFIVYFLFFWQKCQRWVGKERDGLQREIQVAPAVVSGFLVFSLVICHGFLFPGQQTYAECTGGIRHRYYARSSCGSGPGHCTGQTSPYCSYEPVSVPTCSVGCNAVAGSSGQPPGCGSWNSYSDANFAECPEFPAFFPFFLPFLMPFLNRLRFRGGH